MPLAISTMGTGKTTSTVDMVYIRGRMGEYRCKIIFHSRYCRSLRRLYNFITCATVTGTQGSTCNTKWMATVLWTLRTATFM